MLFLYLVVQKYQKRFVFASDYDFFSKIIDFYFLKF